MKYKTIEASCTDLYKEKASKFFALLFHVSNEDEVKAILAKVKKEYYDSRHICYAYVIGYNKELWRVNDAGEPSNTAGKPILGQLTSFDLTNVLLVVVRYFGGTKLGVGGLIQAYKAAAQLVLEKAVVVERDIYVNYELEVGYESLSLILKGIKTADGIILNNKQEESCFITCTIPLANENLFYEIVKLRCIKIGKYE